MPQRRDRFGGMIERARRSGALPTPPDTSRSMEGVDPLAYEMLCQLHPQMQSSLKRLEEIVVQMSEALTESQKFRRQTDEAIRRMADSVSKVNEGIMRQRQNTAEIVEAVGRLCEALDRRTASLTEGGEESS